MTTSEEWLERLGLAEPTTDIYRLPSNVTRLRPARCEDLHLSEWCDFIVLEAEALKEVALRHESEPGAGTKAHFLHLLSNAEALLKAARRTVNKGAP